MLQDYSLETCISKTTENNAEKAYHRDHNGFGSILGPPEFQNIEVVIFYDVIRLFVGNRYGLKRCWQN